MKAVEWVKKVFAPRITAAPDGKIDKIVLAPSKDDRNMPFIFITVERFAQMFEKEIEDPANKTDLRKAEAIAAKEGVGYTDFIKKCKEEGLFK